jgi:hypothetical protein
MRDGTAKQTILRTLGLNPRLADLETLHNCDASKAKKLLVWLDQSGLALYFLHRLRSLNATNLIPEHFREALESRAEKNRVRVQNMLSEFERLNHSFARRGVNYCAIKGFTLVPDFCLDPFFRHQTDFDFLIEPASVPQAAAALEQCGYKLEESTDGEMTFSTPLSHIPSLHDDIYDVPRHRQVDLHTVLWHEKDCVSLSAPTDCFSRMTRRTVQGISFPSLAPDDMFLLQAVHAFQHLLGSWVRLSWLYELDFFLGNHGNDPNFWEALSLRAGSVPQLRDAVGLVLSLTSRLFSRPLPSVLNKWCIAPLPREVDAWLEWFGPQWAISDFPGQKLTLFVHKSFLSDAKSWQKYLLSRIFPLHFRSSMVELANSSWKVKVKAAATRYVRVFGRAAFHLRQAGSLAVNAVRWKRALRAAAKPSMLATK